MTAEQDRVDAIEAKISAAGFIVSYDNSRPDLGEGWEWTVAAIPTRSGVAATTDRAARGRTKLEALEALHQIVFG